MKYRMKNRRARLTWILVAVISCFTSFNAVAQYEPMFTQYMFNETFINPAYVGSRESIATTLLYRDQWVGIDGAPKTQTLSIHAPIAQRKLGVGLSVMNETIGVTHQLSVYGQVAYRILFPHSALSFGVGGGFVNDIEKLSEVHTITPNDHQFAINVKKLFLPNAGFGIYYYSKKFYAGFSIPRLIENKIDPTQLEVVVNNVGNFKLWHYYLATGYVFDLNDDLKFKPSILVKTVQNAPVELDGNVSFLIRDFLWLGAGYRTGDAISAMIGFQFTRQLRLGYSYDYTLTELQDYNSGSHEITLRYDFDLKKSSVISTRYF